MARGYLGKISAIVSANTGDYVRKLDDSARRTKAFAQTIQTDLNRASRDSAKALSSMLTPLQRLERAIQNATSQRLKFNGVDTAINSVKQLQAAVSRLEGSEVDVAVRTSGLRNITELKTTLQNLKQEDVDLFVNLVGSEGTVADLRKIRESYREIDGKVVSTNVAVKADVSQVDRLIELFSQFSKQRLDAVINVVGQQQVDKAAASMRQIFSIAEGLAKPLGGAAQQLAGMSLGIQTQFGPALQRAQQEVQTLSDAADRGARITRRAYNDAAASVERVTAAISRLNEAQSLANSGRTGQELAFAAPRVQEELSRSATLSQQAASLPVTLREDPSVRARIEELARLRQEIAKYQASVERRQVLGLDTSEAQARLDGVIRRSADARAALEQISSDANAATRAFTLIESARQPRGLGLFGSQVGTEEDRAIERARRVSAEFESLPQAAQNGLRGLASIASRVSDAVQRGAANAQQLNDVLDRLSAGVSAGSLESGQQSLGRRIGNGFLNIITPAEAAADTVEAQTQALGRKIGNGFLNIITPAEAAADTVEAQTQALGRKIGNGFLNIITPAEAAADTVEAQTQALGRKIGNGFLNILTESDVESDLTGGLGRAVTDPARQIDGLRGSVSSLESQLLSLPAGIRSQFIPQIVAAREEFLRLRALGPDATAEAIENASNEVDRLNQQLRRVSQVQALPNFADSLNETSLRGAIGNLNALQQILSRVGAEAGSNAAVQFDRMRDAIQRATADGTIGSQAFQNELREIARDAAAAAAETGRIGQGRAFREIQRGGDIARGGFDRLSLATQQAAFAIDDFFSVQGDFSQRIRAVQNNVTQLAFILGGTRGLFIGLGVAIAAQAAVGLVRWYNEGRTAEDQTKALNDALARQKSLVEELAQAFESLGDSIARRAFSQSGQEARAFAKELEEISKKQREAREAQVADLDVNVQRERSEQNRIRGDLESATDPGRRVALVRQLQASQERERQAAAAAVSRTVSGDEVAEAIRGVFQRQIDALGGSGRTSGVSAQLARRANEVIGSIDRGTSVEAIRSQRAALQGEVERLTPAAARGNAFAQREIAGIQSLLSSLELPLRQALDQLTVSILESSSGLSLGIEQAQSDVEDAIRRGVPAAADFQAGLDNTARQLDGAQKRLAEAQKITNQDDRDAAVRRAEAEIRDLQLRQDAINEAAREVRLTTGRGGERTTSALSALQGNERFANEYGRLTARLRDAVDRETQARRELEQATKANDEAAKTAARAELEAASAASDLAAAAAEAALEMEKTLSRIRKIGDDALRGSEQLADDAQRRFTQDPTDANRQARDSAEQQLIRDRERLARANNALDRSRSVAASSDPQILRINEELRRIQDERRQIGDIAAQDRTPEDARRAEELANREAQLQAEREQRLLSLTQAEREQQDAIAQEINARQRLIEQLEKERQFDEEVRRRRNPEGDALRGLDLFDNPAQRQARELEQEIANLNAAFDEIVRGILDANNGVVNADVQQQVEEARKQRDEAERNLIAERQRAAAPAIFGLADSVQNAVLQGPSRAALNVSDISTQEGARELNRLLRGEDSNRDNQNLVELQRQSQALDDLNAKVAALGARVGVA